MAVTKEKIKCIYCDTEFEAEPWKHLRFCSRKCAALYNKRQKFPVEKRTCKECGKEFDYSPTNSKGLKGTFCSQGCHILSMKKNALNETKSCKNCGKEFVVTSHYKHKEYCSSNCFNTTRSEVIKKSVDSIIIPIGYTCKLSISEIRNSVKQIISNYGSIHQQTFFKINPELYYDLMTFEFKESGISYYDRLNLAITGKDTIPNCVICGKKVKFSRFSKKWATTCSNYCKNKLQTARLSPNYNQKAVDIFFELDKKLGTKTGEESQFAGKGGGEICIDNTFWLDYINHKEKVIIEWQERNHLYTKQRDGLKKKLMKEIYPEYKYLTIWEVEWEDSDIDNIYSIIRG